jgi:hypothetical protein
MILAARQVGKSTVCAVKALHVALFSPNSLVLIISASQRQASELFRKVIKYYNQIGKPVPAKNETALSLTLESGARVISLPQNSDTLRGYTPDLVLLDEAAYVDDEVFASISPMVSVSGGQLILLGTPAGKRGFFYELYTGAAGDAWMRIKQDAYSCSRISKAFLESERLALGEWQFASEYECAWTADESAFFSHDEVLAALSSDVLPL